MDRRSRQHDRPARHPRPDHTHPNPVLDRSGRAGGAEYELLRAFEEWLNKKYRAKRHVNFLVFVPTSRDALIPDLLAGRGDLAAGILTLTPERMAKVDGGGPFFRGVKELVVTGPESPVVSTLDDLAGQCVVVRRSSSYWSHLEQLNARCERGQVADQARGGAGGPCG